MSQHTSYTMAGLLAFGGLMGYARKRSIPSLIAGLTFGGAFAYSGYLIQENRDFGHESSLAISALLALSMFRRAMNAKGRAVLPWTLATLGFASGIFHLKKVWEYRWM